jgi:hypothetical protein
LGKLQANSNLTLRLLGSPVVPGRVKYNFWDQHGFSESGDFDVNTGYLLEVFGDYSIKIAGDFNVGGFAKWNSVRLRTNEVSLSGSATEPVYWNVDVRAWTIGAMASFGFTGPL